MSRLKRSLRLVNDTARKNGDEVSQPGLSRLMQRNHDWVLDLLWGELSRNFEVVEVVEVVLFVVSVVS